MSPCLSFQSLIIQCLTLPLPIHSKVYLRTEHAWYVLDTPSAAYRPFYIEFLVQQRVFYELVTEARLCKSLTVEGFAKYLAELDDAEPEIRAVNLEDPVLVRFQLCLYFNALTVR